MRIVDAAVIMAACLAATWIGLRAGRWLGADPQKTGLLLSIAWVLFFTYGRTHTMLSDAELAFGRHRFLIVFFAAAAFASALAVWRARRPPSAVVSALNLVASLLVGMCLVQGVLGTLAGRSAADEEGRLALDPGAARPDIYYVVLDSYAREDVQRELYAFDDSGFLAELEKRGFYVARGASANYCQTILSMASSLNFTYLDGVADRMGAGSRRVGPLVDMLKRGRVADLLNGLGYRFVAFGNGYEAAEIKNADVFWTPHAGWGEFELAWARSTALKILLDEWPSSVEPKFVEFAFERLPDAAELEGPVLVYAHIMAPHPPFLRDADGNRISPMALNRVEAGVVISDQPREQYVEQFTGYSRYTAGQVLATIDTILARYDEPPVIILQSDHGPSTYRGKDEEKTSRYRERLGILNAYLVSEKARRQLYPTISPVNSFRVVFDAYFGSDLGTLEDRSYYSTIRHPYDLTDVTDQVKPAGPVESAAN